MVRILDDIYMTESTGFVNAYIVGKKQNYTLIDTGFDGTADALINELETAGLKLENIADIIITHGHPDHIGGLKKILAKVNPGLSAHRSDVESIQRELGKADCAKTVIDTVLEDGGNINVLGGLEVINLPGHTPGSIALYQKDKKIMFTGDVIKDVEGRGLCIGVPEEYNNDTEQTLKDGQRILEYEIETLLLSHGAPILKDNIQRLYDLKA